MSEKERNNFDLVSYLKFFKSFFIKLTFYSTLIFAVTYFLYDEEIAAIAVYLASDESTFTTGTTISVDGGISI